MMVLDYNKPFSSVEELRQYVVAQFYSRRLTQPEASPVEQSLARAAKNA